MAAVNSPPTRARATPGRAKCSKITDYDDGVPAASSGRVLGRSLQIEHSSPVIEHRSIAPLLPFRVRSVRRAPVLRPFSDTHSRITTHQYPPPILSRVYIHPAPSTRPPPPRARAPLPSVAPARARSRDVNSRHRIHVSRASPPSPARAHLDPSEWASSPPRAPSRARARAIRLSRARRAATLTVRAGMRVDQVQAMGDRVLVVADEAESQTKGGLFIAGGGGAGGPASNLTRTVKSAERRGQGGQSGRSMLINGFSGAEVEFDDGAKGKFVNSSDVLAVLSCVRVTRSSRR